MPCRRRLSRGEHLLAVFVGHSVQGSWELFLVLEVVGRDLACSVRSGPRRSDFSLEVVLMRK